MSKEKEIRPQIYYYIRKGWYDQLIKLCDSAMIKLGKDPNLVYWKAYGCGMSGNIPDCLRQLESMQGRRELQFPVSLALLHFHSKASPVDHDAIDLLTSEMSIAEDVSKDNGIILAGRFALFTEDYSLASRLSKKLLGSDNRDKRRGNQELNPSTKVEWEGAFIECWVSASQAIESLKANHSTAELRAATQSIDGLVRSGQTSDVDFLMLFARCQQFLRHKDDVFNIYNQIIAMYPDFLPALAEKAILLASLGEWDQSLDTAQRVLDVDSTNIDALQVIAVHAFTQESQPHDALQKMDDLERTLADKEPNAVNITLNFAALFSSICARQPRALQLCVRSLERLLKRRVQTLSVDEEALLLTELGFVYLHCGQEADIQKAMRAFREVAKKNPDSVAALQGMISCQMREGLYDDAEGQIELLGVVHNPDDLGAEFAYLQALQVRGSKRDASQHLKYIERCYELFDAKRVRGAIAAKTWTYHEGLRDFVLQSPDFLMLLALEYMSYLESAIPTWLFFSGAGPRKGTIGMRLEGSSSSADAIGGDASASGMRESSFSGKSEMAAPVKKGFELLQKVLRTCPGFVCAYIETARCLSTIGQHEEASRCLHQALGMQPNSIAALVALAKVEMARNNPAAADRALEQALSNDFTIRSITLFRLIRCSVMGQQVKIDEAITEMEQILQLPEIRGSVPVNDNNAFGDSLSFADRPSGSNSGSGDATSTSYADSFRLTDDDRAAAFVIMSSLYSKSRRTKEANKVLSEGKVVFAGSPQEVIILVAASQLAVEKNDYDTAIRMLNKIAEDNPLFTRAQLLKADILLNYNRDQEGYTGCFEKLVEREPSSKNYTLLGEAYIRILNPEKAVEAFEFARRLDPSNGRLRAQIGRSLVATHEYHRAIEFYEQAIREVSMTTITTGSAATTGVAATGASVSGVSSEAVSLSHDLARLFMKLDRHESAVRVLAKVLHDSHSKDITDYKEDVRTLRLIALVQQKVSPGSVIDTLKKAYDLQKDVLNMVRAGSAVLADGETVDKERQQLSELCERRAAALAASATSGHGPAAEQAAQAVEQLYTEAVQYNAQNITAMLGLATLFRERGDLAHSEMHYRKIVQADPSNEEANVMLSEALFAGSDPDGATQPLEALLKTHPNNYRALERLLSLFRRAGKLDEAPGFLKAAENADRRSIAHAGFHFCSGLYARYTNNIGKAISEFNLARKDDTWGPKALTHMVELYLNPDQEGIWEERDVAMDESTREHILVAEKLLKELRPKTTDPLRFAVLENYCLLATRDKLKIDRAMKSFMDLLDEDQDYLPAILGMATGFMIEKTSHKAKNLLKRVAKMEISHRDGDDFTKANLLLAKFCVDKSKFDSAQDLCKKCLAQDRSCSAAWEILGLVFEKENDYTKAAECYEKAWKLEFEASATVGFKLAYSYLKCRRFVDSIDVCESVLDQFPDYPRISDEILKKAQAAIRMAQ